MASKIPELSPAEHPYVFSPSQIETADLCLRKWAFDKIDKDREPETESQKLGTATHDELERYLKGGVINTKIRPGKIAMSAVEHLPFPRSPNMEVEEWFVRKRGVPTYWGKMDVRFLIRPIPIVYDHKTCKSFSWAKSGEDLVSTVQSGMYGWSAMEDVGASEAELRWTYMKTVGSPQSMPVIARITRMQAEDVMARVEKTADQLILLKTSLTKGEAIEAPANFSSCEAFGGCAHKSKCKPTALNALSAILEQKDMGSNILEDLRKRKEKKDGAATELRVVSDAEAPKAAVNPPERDRTQQPPPPGPMQVDGKWFQPVWNDADFAWEYPKEYQEALDALEARQKAEKKAAAAAAAATEKAAAGATSRKKRSESEALDEQPLEGLLDMLVDKLAERIAAKLKG